MNLETLIDSLPGLIFKDGLFYIMTINKTENDFYSVVYVGTGGFDRKRILAQTKSKILRNAVLEMVKLVKEHVRFI